MQEFIIDINECARALVKLELNFFFKMETCCVLHAENEMVESLVVRYAVAVYPIIIVLCIYVILLFGEVLFSLLKFTSLLKRYRICQSHYYLWNVVIVFSKAYLH